MVAAFDLWGYSAGAQFVHRFLLSSRSRRCGTRSRQTPAGTPHRIRAPTSPTGLRHPELDLGATVTREHLVLMRGQLDTERGDDVRSEPAADAQGRTRYQRADFVHAAACAADPDTNWQLIDVPGAEHDQKARAAAAQRFLLAPPRPAAVPYLLTTERGPLPVTAYGESVKAVRSGKVTPDLR